MRLIFENDHEFNPCGVDHDLSDVLEVHSHAALHIRLHLAKTPIGALRMAHKDAWFQQ